MGVGTLFRNSFALPSEHGQVVGDCAARPARDAGVDWCGCWGPRRGTPVEPASLEDLVMGPHIGATRRFNNRSTVHLHVSFEVDRTNRAKHATEWYRAPNFVTKETSPPEMFYHSRRGLMLVDGVPSTSLQKATPGTWDGSEIGSDRRDFCSICR